MKIKELIELLKQYNPDGTAAIQVFTRTALIEVKVEDVKSDGCGMINALIIGVI